MVYSYSSKHCKSRIHLASFCETTTLFTFRMYDKNLETLKIDRGLQKDFLSTQFYTSEYWFEVLSARYILPVSICCLSSFSKERAVSLHCQVLHPLCFSL